MSKKSLEYSFKEISGIITGYLILFITLRLQTKISYVNATGFPLISFINPFPAARKHKKSNKKSKQHKPMKQQDVQQPAPVSRRNFLITNQIRRTPPSITDDLNLEEPTNQSNNHHVIKNKAIATISNIEAIANHFETSCLKNEESTLCERSECSKQIRR